jgi:hypothetical protein
MKAQNIEIFSHDSDVDISHKINTMELDNWINHLKYIKKEIVNLINIYREKLSVKIYNDSVLERLLKKEVENDTLLNALSKYAMVRSNLKECEDIECDMVYITEHESYRRTYLYHIDKYRKLKDDFYNIVQGKFKLLKRN